MKRIIFIALMCSVLLVCLSGYAIALPHGPLPPGKVWVEVGGKWIPVNAPPGDGPYIWRDSKWIPDTTPPPPGSEWVPGHWTAKRWSWSLEGSSVTRHGCEMDSRLLAK